MAGFRASLQPKTGNLAYSASTHGFDHQVHPIRFRMACPVAVNEVAGSSWKMLRGPEIRDWASPMHADADPMGHSATRMGTLVLELASDATGDSQIEKRPAPKKIAAKKSAAAKDVPPAAGWMTVPPAPVETMLLASSALHTMALSRTAAAIEMPAAIAGIHLPMVTGWAAVPPVAVESMVLPASEGQPIETAVAAQPQMPATTQRNYLPTVTGWASLPPVAVESMLVTASALETMSARAAAAQLAAFDLELAREAGLAERIPQMEDGWAELERVAAAPLPAPVSALQSMAAPAAEAGIPSAIELGKKSPAFADEWMVVPAVAVESMALPASSLRVAAFEPAAMQMPSLPAIRDLAWRMAEPAAAAQPGEVASFVRMSSAPESAMAAACATPRLDLTVASEEWAVEELVEVVDACEQFFAAPGAQPVERMLSWTAAEMAAWVDTPAASPLRLAMAIADTFIPAVPMLVRPPEAEPAAVHVFPVHAAEALANTSIVMTGIELAVELTLEETAFVEWAQATPVESMPATQLVAPAAMTVHPVVSIAESVIAAAALLPADAPAPNEAAAVESMVFPTFHAEMMTALSLALPMAAMEIAGKLAAAPETGAGARALPVPQTPAAQVTPAELQPIRKLALAPPEARPEAAPLTIPRQGFHALQSYTQRPLSTVSRRLEWILPAIELIQPPFAMRPLGDKVEDTVTQKKPAKKAAMAEIFSLPEAKKKAVPRSVYYAIKAIAACLVVGGVLWVGSGALRQGPAVNRDVAMLEETAESAADAAAAAAPAAPTGKSAKVQPHGPLAKLKKAIAERAASTVTDGFHGGMEAWGAKPKAWAAGWSRHPEGYVQPGQLALFHPSLAYKDYRLEFFGQIDNKSMGWTVRSKDPKNYYAMKFTVVEPGLRPIIAMVHYPVVDGKRGRQSTTPLNVMVHNNTPMQVAVDVKGDRMVTSIDGQEVDSWVDDTIPAGGVGFFAEAGEKARLYWMKVSKNEDFLGRVCAFMSSQLGDGSNSRAELWSPGMPGSTPRPGQGGPEGSREAALSAAVIGMRSGRRKRHAGVSNFRSEKWSS